MAPHIGSTRTHETNVAETTFNTRRGADNRNEKKSPQQGDGRSWAESSDVKTESSHAETHLYLYNKQQKRLYNFTYMRFEKKVVRDVHDEPTDKIPHFGQKHN